MIFFRFEELCRRLQVDMVDTVKASFAQLFHKGLHFFLLLFIGIPKRRSVLSLGGIRQSHFLPGFQNGRQTGTLIIVPNPQGFRVVTNIIVRDIVGLTPRVAHPTFLDAVQGLKDGLGVPKSAEGHDGNAFVRCAWLQRNFGANVCCRGFVWYCSGCSPGRSDKGHAWVGEGEAPKSCPKGKRLHCVFVFCVDEEKWSEIILMTWLKKLWTTTWLRPSPQGSRKRSL